MKTKLILLVLFLHSLMMQGQSWEFTSKLYLIDGQGTIDSVLFGNNFSATIGLDTEWNEQDISNIPWNKPEIRSIHRKDDTVDCVIQSFVSDSLFPANYDLKIDMRPGGAYNPEGTSFIFKLEAEHYPVEIYSDFSDMYENSFYCSCFTEIHLYKDTCDDETPASCEPGYSHLYTINDSTESYITIKLDFESGINRPEIRNTILKSGNPSGSTLLLDYTGPLQLFDLSGRKLLDQHVERMRPVDIGPLPKGCYLVMTNRMNFKIIKTDILN